MTAVLLAGSISLNAQMEVRNGISDSDSNPSLLADGTLSTGWTSDGAGSSASILLDDPSSMDAGFVMATKVQEAPAYELLVSDNYRDWILVQEGLAATEEAPGDVFDFDELNAQYVRLVSQSSSPATWEIAAGSRAEVEYQIQGFQPHDWGDISDPLIIADMIDRVFDWQHGHMTTSQDRTGWVTGAFFTGVSGLYATTELDKYKQAILDKGNFANWKLRLRTGNKTFYHADDHCLGQSWLELYLLDDAPQEKWITDVQARLDRVMANALPGRQDMNWCDALYMSPPVYVRLAEITGDDSYRTFIDTQWWDVTDYLYSTEHNLFFRDSSYFNDKEPNGLPVFWSRGNGWVIGGLVRMLQYMPADWPKRADYENLLEEMCTALVAIQQDDGLWGTSLLYPAKFSNERETSGSAFFTYGMAYGINEGILDESVFGPVIEKAWEGLSTMLNPNGTIEFIQQIGADPKPNNGEYTNKDYGYGAFILAGTEMIRYYVDKSAGTIKGQWAANLAAPVYPGNPDTWTKVDNFEGGFSWNKIETYSQSGKIIQDPNDMYGSKVLAIYTGNRTSGTYRAAKSIPPIANGTTGTVYQRFAYNNIEVDVLMGVSDESGVDAWGDYETGRRIYFDYNVMEARSGGSYIPIGEDFLQLETWYETWSVINNATNRYDVYIRGGSNYPEITLLKSNIPFRNGTSKSIITYALSFNSQYCEGSFYLDDLHVDASGENLARPAGVNQTSYSPWSDISMRMPSLSKSTDVGTLWDEYFPWIYHKELNGWCYLWPQETYTNGYWAWKLQPGSWIWMSTIWDGWYYDYSTTTWSKME